MAPARRQSQFIAEAIRAYVAEQARQTLRARLVAGYQANADADVTLAAEWEPIEEEVWRTDPVQAEQEQSDVATNPAW
ncbi:MAG TPA: hypothetical protein PKE45_13355 [Caldilineaceae bacterium]|nr:hypothetical protein [Caldilineaceae bacterium]